MLCGFRTGEDRLPLLFTGREDEFARGHCRIALGSRREGVTRHAQQEVRPIVARPIPRLVSVGGLPDALPQGSRLVRIASASCSRTASAVFDSRPERVPR